MKRSYSKYSAKDDLLWLILRPWIFIQEFYISF